MSIDDPEALESLIQRLHALSPDATRRWGTLEVTEMLCHLGDGNDSMLQRGRFAGGSTPTTRARPILKWIALYSPLTWSRKAQTSPSVDPKKEGTRPTDFEADRERVIEGLRAVAAAPAGDLPTTHPLFGPMSSRDWYRSAYRHYNHHLSQFGA